MKLSPLHLLGLLLPSLAFGQISVFTTTDFTNDVEPLLDTVYATTRVKSDTTNWDILLDDGDSVIEPAADFFANPIGNGTANPGTMPFVLSFDGNAFIFEVTVGASTSTLTYDIAPNPTDVGGIALGFIIDASSRVNDGVMSASNLSLFDGTNTYGVADGLVSFGTAPEPLSGRLQNWMVITSGTGAWNEFELSGDLYYFNSGSNDTRENLKFEAKVFSTVVVPEPSTVALSGLALLGLLIALRRVRK